jgi:hypothetical protein
MLLQCALRIDCSQRSRCSRTPRRESSGFGRTLIDSKHMIDGRDQFGFAIVGGLCEFMQSVVDPDDGAPTPPPLR